MLLHFQGRLNKSDGYFYEGGWLHGKKHGQGLVIYANGDCFEGYWRKDLREGEGKYWIRKINDNNESLKVLDGNSGKLITGVWQRDMMKTGIINKQQETGVELGALKTVDS